MMKKITRDNIELTKEDFSFVCPLKTEDMNAIEGGYFCGKCEKKVHDVTNYTPEEFSSLKKRSENLCVTIKKVATVSLVLGLSACSQQTTGKISSNPKCNTQTPNNEQNNRLRPFPTVDKNQTIRIDRTEEPQLAGGIMVPPPELTGEQVAEELKDRE